MVNLYDRVAKYSMLYPKKKLVAFKATLINISTWRYSFIHVKAINQNFSWINRIDALWINYKSIKYLYQFTKIILKSNIPENLITLEYFPLFFLQRWVFVPLYVFITPKTSPYRRTCDFVWTLSIYKTEIILIM